MREPEITITFKDALTSFLKRKRPPKNCGICIMTCVDCFNNKYLDGNGKIKPQGWRGPVNCAECRTSRYRRNIWCWLLDKNVGEQDKPICTAYDVDKALLEII